MPAKGKHSSEFFCPHCPNAHGVLVSEICISRGSKLLFEGAVEFFVANSLQSKRVA